MARSMDSRSRRKRKLDVLVVRPLRPAPEQHTLQQDHQEAQGIYEYFVATVTSDSWRDAGTKVTGDAGLG